MIDMKLLTSGPTTARERAEMARLKRRMEELEQKRAQQPPPIAQPYVSKPYESSTVQDKIAKAREGIQKLLDEGRPVSFAALTEVSGLTRSWLYRHHEIRDEVERIMDEQQSLEPKDDGVDGKQPEVLAVADRPPPPSQVRQHTVMVAQPPAPPDPEPSEKQEGFRFKIERNTDGIKDSAAQKRQDCIDRTNNALIKLLCDNKPINFDAVAKEAGVTRAWLYNQPELRETIEIHRGYSSKKMSVPQEQSTPSANEAPMDTNPTPIDKLKERNRKLRKQNARLRKQAQAALERRNDELRAQNADLRRQIEMLYGLLSKN